MGWRFHIVDVFTPSAFAGNTLAVLPDARGLTTAQMQAIAREFNFSETTFVFPDGTSGDRARVRIFTPRAEVDFAGPPTIGTACVLVMNGCLAVDLETLTRLIREENPGPTRLVLEENVGPIAVEVERRDGSFHAALTLEAKIDMPSGAPAPADAAAALSLDPTDVHRTFFAGVGLPFCFVELTSEAVVDRAVIDRPAWSRVLGPTWSPHVFLFAGRPEHNGSLYARMLAPALGVEEDPATGSACAALVGALASRPEVGDGDLRLTIWQGVAMGRPSAIEALARKHDGRVTSVGVAGAVTPVATGEIEAPALMEEVVRCGGGQNHAQGALS
jgi:trans-2,3-dihydro-3-hydroxyanthranilate isomerase